MLNTSNDGAAGDGKPELSTQQLVLCYEVDPAETAAAPEVGSGWPCRVMRHRLMNLSDAGFACDNGLMSD